MPVIALQPRRIAKPWGRRDLGPSFEAVPASGAPVGEIRFEADGEPELLVKYLFTSQTLSIQVHPDDAHAQASGQTRGKSETWVILDAQPGARVGLGLREPVSPDALRAAANDGSIEDLLDWRPVSAGDVLSSPGGIIHAIGPGLSLIEVQQNSDVTYRLHDWGRPRPLHVEDAVRVARPRPARWTSRARLISDGRVALVDGPAFVLERWAGPRATALDAAASRPAWLIPIAGEVETDGTIVAPGSVWMVDEPVDLRLGPGADLLVAAPGTAPLQLRRADSRGSDVTG